jgi:hypothetical protein
MQVVLIIQNFLLDLMNLCIQIICMKIQYFYGIFHIRINFWKLMIYKIIYHNIIHLKY